LGIVNQESRHRAVTSKSVNQSKSQGLLGTWIWRHDPEQYATENYEKALIHLTEGSPFSNTNIPSGHIYQPWTIDELLSASERGEEIVLDGDWE
jgi:hypothetical protein